MCYFVENQNFDQNNDSNNNSLDQLQGWKKEYLEKLINKRQKRNEEQERLRYEYTRNASNFRKLGDKNIKEVMNTQPLYK